MDSYFYISKQGEQMTYSSSQSSKSDSVYQSGKCYLQKSKDQTSQSKLEEYLNFFDDVMPDISHFKIEDIPKESLKHHKVKIMDYDDAFWGKMINDGSIYVEPSKIKLNGLECLFDVLIGRFYLAVSVLNIFRNSTEKKANQKKDQKYVGSGTFGTVKLANIEGRRVAVKRLNFPEGRSKPVFIPNLLDPTDLCFPDQIRKAVKEYSIYKICSMLQIGPQVIFSNVYDLVCYNDGIEFQMQLCKPVQFNIKRSYEKDLKKCVAMLHASKFVHNDIKPENTLFSPSLNKYVLSDFGLSQSIKQSIGEKTETYFRGTMKYASSEMRALHPNKLGFVNLFYHDMHSLKICIQQSEQYIEAESDSESSLQQQSSCRNPFSMIEREESEVPDQSYGTQSEYQDNYAEATTQSSSSYQSSIMSEQFIENSLEINYYIMKTIYALFKEERANEAYSQLPNNREKIKDMIEETASKVCAMEENQRILGIVTKMVETMLVPSDQRIANTTTFTRFTLRTYGFYSDEFINQLSKIRTSQSLPSLNYKELDGRIRYLDKLREAHPLRNFQSLCSTLNKHRRLSNIKKYLTSVRLILNSGKLLAGINRQNIKAILRGCLTLINRFQSSDLASVYELFGFLGDSTVLENQVKSDLPLGNLGGEQIFQQRCKVLKFLHEFARANSFEGCLIESCFFHAYLSIGAGDFASAQILPTIVDLQKEDRSNFTGIILNDADPGQDLSARYLQSTLSLLSCLEAVNIKEACSLVMANLEQIKKTPLSNHKINILLNCSKTLAASCSELSTAEELNQLFYELQREYYFPVVSMAYAAQYFFLKGAFADKRLHYLEAIQHYKSSIAALSDHQRVSASYDQIEKIYSALYLAYERLGDHENAIKYFEQIVYLSLDNENCEVEKKLVFLGNFIRCKIKLGHTQGFYQLFDIFFQLKMSLAKDADKSQFCHPALRRVTAFDMRVNEPLQTKAREGLMSAKMALVQVLAKYLPVFLVQYRSECEQIARYNIEKLHIKSKALPYLWNYFRKFPFYQISEDAAFFEKVYTYSCWLIESNSNRVALKFLQKYAYRIPDECPKLQELVFKKLYVLSRDLGHRKFKLYSFIYKYRPYESKASYDLCESEIKQTSELDTRFPLKRAIRKKIAALLPQSHPGCLQNNSEDAFVEKLTDQQFRKLLKAKKKQNQEAAKIFKASGSIIDKEFGVHLL